MKKRCISHSTQPESSADSPNSFSFTRFYEDSCVRDRDREEMAMVDFVQPAAASTTAVAGVGDESDSCREPTPEESMHTSMDTDEAGSQRLSGSRTRVVHGVHVCMCVREARLCAPEDLLVPETMCVRVHLCVIWSQISHGTALAMNSVNNVVTPGPYRTF